jgi:hypothetical protein
MTDPTSFCITTHTRVTSPVLRCPHRRCRRCATRRRGASGGDARPLRPLATIAAGLGLVLERFAEPIVPVEPLSLSPSLSTVNTHQYKETTPLRNCGKQKCLEPVRNLEIGRAAAEKCAYSLSSCAKIALRNYGRLKIPAFLMVGKDCRSTTTVSRSYPMRMVVIPSPVC